MRHALRSWGLALRSLCEWVRLHARLALRHALGLSGAYPWHRLRTLERLRHPALWGLRHRLRTGSTHEAEPILRRLVLLCETLSVNVRPPHMLNLRAEKLILQGSLPLGRGKLLLHQLAPHHLVGHLLLLFLGL